MACIESINLETKLEVIYSSDYQVIGGQLISLLSKKKKKHLASPGCLDATASTDVTKPWGWVKAGSRTTTFFFPWRLTFLASY
jgi:hypothetical protein